MACGGGRRRHQPEHGQDRQGDQVGGGRRGEQPKRPVLGDPVEELGDRAVERGHQGFPRVRRAGCAGSSGTAPLGVTGRPVPDCAGKAAIPGPGVQGIHGLGGGLAGTLLLAAGTARRVGRIVDPPRPVRDSRSDHERAATADRLDLWQQPPLVFTFTYRPVINQGLALQTR